MSSAIVTTSVSLTFILLRETQRQFILFVGLRGFHVFFLLIFQIFCNEFAMHLLSEKGNRPYLGNKATQTRCSGWSDCAV